MMPSIRIAKAAIPKVLFSISHIVNSGFLKSGQDKSWLT